MCINHGSWSNVSGKKVCIKELLMSLVGDVSVQGERRCEKRRDESGPTMGKQ